MKSRTVSAAADAGAAAENVQLPKRAERVPTPTRALPAFRKIAGAKTGDEERRESRRHRGDSEARNGAAAPAKRMSAGQAQPCDGASHRPTGSRKVCPGSPALGRMSERRPPKSRQPVPLPRQRHSSEGVRGARYADDRNAAAASACGRRRACFVEQRRDTAGAVAGPVLRSSTDLPSHRFLMAC
jgi:hypothetical protein